MLLITLLSFSLFFFGCSPCERLSRRCPPTEHITDSIVVSDTLILETTITDTLLYVKLQPEYVYIQNPITDTARAETAYARATSWSDGKSVFVYLVNKDSAEILVQRIHTLERQLRSEKQKKERVSVKTEYKTRGIVKVGAWIGLASVIFCVLYILLLILKK